MVCVWVFSVSFHVVQVIETDTSHNACFTWDVGKNMKNTGMLSFLLNRFGKNGARSFENPTSWLRLQRWIRWCPSLMFVGLSTP